MSTSFSRPDEGFYLRADALDTIAAVLPMNRRDMLADILGDEDVETLVIWSRRAWVKTPCVP